MRPSIHIRLGRSNDTKAIAVLATQVWLHTYATTGITIDVTDYVLTKLTPKKYEDILRDSASQLFVAERDHSLLGFAVVTFGSVCPSGADSAAELQTLYVQEHFLEGGIGKALLREAELSAHHQTGKALWLAVNVKNARATAFYQHLGYTKVGTTYFVMGEVRHENHVLIGPG